MRRGRRGRLCSRRHEKRRNDAKTQGRTEVDGSLSTTFRVSVFPSFRPTQVRSHHPARLLQRRRVGEDFVHGVTKKGATTQRRKDGRRLTGLCQPPSVFPSFRLSDRPRYGLTTPLAFSSAAASMPVRPSK